MNRQPQRVTAAAIKQAIEQRDGSMLASFYADDAHLRIIDHNNPPSRPREIHGRAAIASFWDDICSRAITHRVDVSVTQGDMLAFTQDCTYPDGAKVSCIAIVEIGAGGITRQSMVQAWDE